MDKRKICTIFLSLILITACVTVLSGCSGSSTDSTEKAETSEATEPSEKTEKKDPSEYFKDDAEYTEEIFDIDYDTGVSYSEEAEGAEINIVKKDASEFIGEWEAKSGQAMYLYGNVSLNIKSGGKWTGVITDTKLKGSWKQSGDRLHMNNDMFSFDLAFDSSGKLLMIESNPDGDIYTVLTRI